MSAYYNENDPRAAAWLRELITQGLIADGYVDDRSITDVRPSDLNGFTQCHFFAGIGGWSYAMRLAGWPDDRPAWTGSCPCQPYSVAGKRLGASDARHLWPEWFRLISELRPIVIFGEQVGSKAALTWLDTVCAQLEASDYAAGAVDCCAAGIGAPHLRQRIYWLAESNRQRRNGQHTLLWSEADRREATTAIPEVAGVCAPSNGMGDAGCAGLARRTSQRANDAAKQPTAQRASGWSGAGSIDCTDGRRRPVEPGTFPLAHGVPARVGRLRGYGNAIVPQLAAEVIGAYMETAL